MVCLSPESQLSIPHRLIRIRLSMSRRRSALRLQRHASSGSGSASSYPSPSTSHRLDVLPVFERLGEVADVAGDVLVALEGERYQRLRTLLEPSGNGAMQLHYEIGAQPTIKQKVNHGWVLTTRPE